MVESLEYLSQSTAAPNSTEAKLTRGPPFPSPSSPTKPTSVRTLGMSLTIRPPNICIPSEKGRCPMLPTNRRSLQMEIPDHIPHTALIHLPCDCHTQRVGKATLVQRPFSLQPRLTIILPPAYSYFFSRRTLLLAYGTVTPHTPSHLPPVTRSPTAKSFHRTSMPSFHAASYRLPCRSLPTALSVDENHKLHWPTATRFESDQAAVVITLSAARPIH